MEKEILYFGYGANAHKDMIRALIGRAPKGFRAKLKNYGLFVQSWKDIPSSVREILGNVWGTNFNSYIAIPLKGATTWGTAWKITRTERNIIGEWEFHNKWFTPVNINIEDEKGKTFGAETEIILNFKPREPLVNKKSYPFFVTNKKEILKVARKVRKKFLESINKLKGVRETGVKKNERDIEKGISPSCCSFGLSFGF
ncbi:MAG: gamma-glutamylcyclotransferase [Candidatus Pacearchaeota archaeon]|jgi:hypothetical protein